MKKKISNRSQPNESVFQNCKHGGSLCPLPVPRNAARLMTRGGVGEVNDITGPAHI